MRLYQRGVLARMLILGRSATSRVDDYQFNQVILSPSSSNKSCGSSPLSTGRRYKHNNRNKKLSTSEMGQQIDGDFTLRNGIDHRIGESASVPEDAVIFPTNST